MITAKQSRTILGSRVYDRDGEMIGRVAEVYVVGADRPPSWLLVMDDSAPPRTHVAPCDGAELTGTGVRLAVAGRAVEAAPALTRPPNEPITEADEARLIEHYTTSGAAAADHGSIPEGEQTAMTRSEERLDVTTTTEVTGRVRVRRYIETENVQFTVPVRREKISIEHLPPAGREQPAAPEDTTSPADPSAPRQNAASADGIPEEIILHEERVVIVKEVVPTERIRLSRNVVTDIAAVEAPLRKERIELDQPHRDTQPLE